MPILTLSKKGLAASLSHSWHPEPTMLWRTRSGLLDGNQMLQPRASTQHWHVSGTPGPPSPTQPPAEYSCGIESSQDQWTTTSQNWKK
jgi:hypothetical protein